MTRRDILKGLTVSAACTRAFATTPQKGVGILVRIQKRHSDLCLLRGGGEISRRRIPIGRWHFVNDVACCLGIDRKCAYELVGKYGLPPREGHGAATPAPRQQRGVIRNASGSIVSVPRDQYTRIVEARAVEFAGLVRDGVIAARAVKASTTPILLIGEWIIGLDRLIERGALWNAPLVPEASAERKAQLYLKHPEGTPKLVGVLPYLIHPPSKVSSTASWIAFRDKTLLPMIRHEPDDPNLPNFLKQVETILAWRARISPEERFWKKD